MLLPHLQEARREELLVNRLMRQSQQERRIATQLLQLRHEKAIICQNRIFREQQYEERRQKDFQEALDKEAVSASSCSPSRFPLPKYDPSMFSRPFSGHQIETNHPHCTLNITPKYK